MSANQPSQYHVMPEWFEYLRRHVVLSGLLVAQWIVTTLLILQISVSDPGQWQTWTWVDWSNAVVAVLMGMAGAGVALGISSAMAEAFGLKKWITGLFGFLGMLGLVAVDIWAGIAERSRTARPTPADSLLVDWTGIEALRVVPASVVIVACLLATLILYYGWTNRPPVVMTAEEAERRRQEKLANARYKAQLRTIQAGGLAKAGRAFGQGITGRKSEPSPAGDAADSQGVIGEVASDSEPLPRNVSRMPKPNGLQWTAKDLQAHILAEYGVTIPDDRALNAVQTLGKGRKIEGAKGTPYYVHPSTAKKWARQTYGQQEIAD